ncbi:MAG: type II secretion system F family protein [Candidatus Bathyarchaeia archaeon]|jgi:flagellar protein FlaJ
MAKITKKATQENTVSAFKAPWLLAFQYLGGRLQKYLPYFSDLGSNMQKAGLKISIHSYVSLMALLSAISFAAGFSATLIVALVFAIPILLTILFAFGVSIMSSALVFGVLYGLPSFLATSRRRRMDLELPYVTTHMSILAAAGMPPARMFKLLEDSRTTPEVASEANEVVRDVEILGDDIITALEAERKRSPSSVFAEILEGLVATIRSGGNMKGYLQDSTRMMMDLRRVAAKQMIESLAAFADIYVTMLVVFPLLIIVMFSVMALIGGGIGGLSVTTMMALVTYGIVPLSAAVVLVMLDSMLVED